MDAIHGRGMMSLKTNPDEDKVAIYLGIKTTLSMAGRALADPRSGVTFQRLAH